MFTPFIWTYFLGFLYSVESLVRLTYPPARKYDFDSLNNVTSEGPCGVPKGLGPITILPAGSTFNVTWHLGRVDEGSFSIELRNSEDKLVSKLTEGFVDTQDPTISLYPVTLPKKECNNCYIRLIREALDISRKSSEDIIYWSCADVNIVNPKQINGTTKCSYHGEFQNNKCGCEKLYSGQFCENKDECRTDEDCKPNGKCYSVETKLYPRMQCFCRSGWFGETCMQESSVKSLPDKLEGYHHQNLSDNYNMFWKILPDKGEIEIVLRVRTPGYIGIGWHSKGQNNSCLEFPHYIIPNEFTTHSSLNKLNNIESSELNSNSQSQTNDDNEENMRKKRANDDYESNSPSSDSPNDEQSYDYEDISGVTDTPTTSVSTTPVTKAITELRALKTRRPLHASTKMVAMLTTAPLTKINTMKTTEKKLTSPANTMNSHTTETNLNSDLNFTDYQLIVSTMSSPHVKQTVSPVHRHPTTTDSEQHKHITPADSKTELNEIKNKTSTNMSDIDRLNQDMKDATILKDTSENLNRKYITIIPTSKTKLNDNNRNEKDLKSNNISENLDYNTQSLEINNLTDSIEDGDLLNQDIPANINNTTKVEINYEDNSNETITNNQTVLNVNDDIISTHIKNTKNETANQNKIGPNIEANENMDNQATENTSNNTGETITNLHLLEEDNKKQFIENSTTRKHQMDFTDYPQNVTAVSIALSTEITGKEKTTRNNINTKLNKGHDDSMRTEYNETNKNSTDNGKTKPIKYENSSKTDLITNLDLSGPNNTQTEQKENTSYIFNSSFNISTAWNMNSLNNFWNSSTATSIILNSGMDKDDDRNLKSTNINYSPASSTVFTNSPLISDLSTDRIPRKNESPTNIIINRDFSEGPESETGDNGQMRENVLTPNYSQRDLKHEIRGSMYCSDMVIASVKDGDYLRINDYYSRDHSTPMLDIALGGTNGLTAALALQHNEITTILFRRKLKATEPTDQSFVKDPMEIIWAIGQENGHVFFGKPNDPEYYKTGVLLYHGQNSSDRGVVTVNIFELLNYTSSNDSDNSVLYKPSDERDFTTPQPFPDSIFVSVCLANKTWKEDLQNPESSYYQEVQYQIENATAELLRNIPEVKEVHITRFREGSVLADLDVVLKTTDNINTTVKKVNDTLQNAVASGHIGDIGVDDTYLRVEYPASNALLGIHDNGFSFWQIHIYAIIGCICGLVLIAVILANCKLYRERQRNKLKQSHHGRLIATPLWKEYPFTGNNNPVFEDFDMDSTKYDKRTIYSDHDMTLTRKEKRLPVPPSKSNGEMKTSFDDGRKSANGSVVMSGNNWPTPVNRYYEDESIPQPIVAEIRETPPSYNHAYISVNHNLGHSNNYHRKRSITEVSDPSDSYFMPKTSKPCIYSGEVVSVYVDYQNKPHEEGY